MNLEQKINEELKSAMKSGDKLRLETLRSVRASIIEFAKSGLERAMTEEDEIKILNSLAKKRKDAIEMYANAGRTELKDKEAAELAIIQEFLPAQISDDKIRDIIREVIAQSGAAGMKDMGKVMGPSMKKLQVRQMVTKYKLLLKKY